ncbi:MAG: DUF1553 domain-containing protein [Opitutaceae bacterium]|nr:DUF1553 domain-containing protein [Opitutaceae bacterium]
MHAIARGHRRGDIRSRILPVVGVRYGRNHEYSTEGEAHEAFALRGSHKKRIPIHPRLVQLRLHGSEESRLRPGFEYTRIGDSTTLPLPPPPYLAFRRQLPLALSLTVAASLHSAAAATEIPEQIDFNRDVRPIISDNCYHCHGPDADNQKSDFRLDTREKATADLGDAFFGIVPGDLEASDLHWRIWEDYEEDLMPPVSSKLSLTETEKHILDRWIEQGAPYDEHWSFKPITRPTVPEIDPHNQRRGETEIDAFVVDRLLQEGLSPSPLADKETLIRRVSLDLTGLPSTLSEVETFLADESPSAWEHAVDRLLASPSYGERMALVWLDAARYADSGGYQNDILRSQWPWRDWVIDAYNANMPFDQFTIEQLAGDLLETPSENQLLATAFNRNHRINNEGGIIPEEYLVEYVADRVETTSTVWLGLTMGCARCHDHKYDPLSQQDFFEMFAFFHNVPENGRDGTIAPKPNMAVYHGATAEAHAVFKEQAAEVEKMSTQLSIDSEDDFSGWLQETEHEFADLLGALREIPAPQIHVPFDSMKLRALPNLGTTKLKPQVQNPGKGDSSLVPSNFGRALKIGPGTYGRITSPHGDKFTSGQARSWIFNVRAPAKFAGSEGPMLVCAEANSLRGYRLMLEDQGVNGHYRLSVQIAHDVRAGDALEVVTESIIPKGDWLRIGVTWDGSGQAAGLSVFINGSEVEITTLRDGLATPVSTAQELLIGARDEADAQERLRDSTFLNGLIDDLQIYDREIAAAEIQALSAADPRYLMIARMNADSRAQVKDLWFRETDAAIALKASQAEHDAALATFEKEHVVRVSIMDEMETPRETFLLDRGAYDQPDKSQVLHPTVPDSLPPMADDLPRNRLGLAKWLLDESNPLTARVQVNRYWQMYFGTGLVKTPEDFGSQGAVPSHPELLDWLASEFRDSGWDIKAMQKRIVMSATYRQSSKVTPELLENDPANRLLARSPRFRLSGQALRDQALAVSGLIAPTRGGPPVMPYQPEGLWDELSAKGYKYIVGDGADLYRRSLYTFWRRTIPPPSMMNFDNASREICSVNLSTTNTPLQALNLMNDPQFVEAARALAERMILEGGETVTDQINFGHRTVLARQPAERTQSILSESFADYREHYRTEPDKALDLVLIGASIPDERIEAPDLAAMTMVASVLLNLDETLNKQ